METTNKAFIGTSLDGYIADKSGGIEWLDSVPIPEGEDMGYFAFMNEIDALVMGRSTFETVLGFDVEWPYKKPVFVLSNTMTEIPESHKEKAFLMNGPLKEILKKIHGKGYFHLYIDGGSTIQGFLKEDLIDELIITQIPIVLGGGSALFGELPGHLEFVLKGSKVFGDQLVQNHYLRSRKI